MTARSAWFHSASELVSEQPLAILADLVQHRYAKDFWPGHRGYHGADQPASERSAKNPEGNYRCKIICQVSDRPLYAHRFKRIILVGGFGDSAYLNQILRQWCSWNGNINLMCPQHPWVYCAYGRRMIVNRSQASCGSTGRGSQRPSRACPSSKTSSLPLRIWCMQRIPRGSWPREPIIYRTIHWEKVVWFEDDLGSFKGLF